MKRKNEAFGQEQPQQQGQVTPDIQQFGQAQSGLMKAAAAIQDQRLRGELMGLAQNMNKQVISLFQKYGMMS